jgi:sugar phosphate isomerase/epimerase
MTAMLPGYNTNGFAHHRLEDALEILAELGYRSVAITVDYHALDPYRPDERQRVRVANLLRRTGLRCVIETGARFLLDPRRKHLPTLLDDDPSPRHTFLTHCLELAAELRADAVSFWSGSSDADAAILWPRLIAGCRALCDEAERRDVRLAFEPEPGMFIDTMAKYERLFEAVDHPLFGLTLDVGHLHCQGELPVAPHIERWKHVLWNVHIEDMRRGVHDHLMFGEGEVDFADVFNGLRAANYTGGVFVELSRHSHDAVNTARKAKAFLDQYLS